MCNRRTTRTNSRYEHVDPTTHFVEAKSELSENAAATLHKKGAVIIVGRERTNSRGPEGASRFGRVIDADCIGAHLSRAVDQVSRNGKPDDQA